MHSNYMQLLGFSFLEHYFFLGEGVCSKLFSCLHIVPIIMLNFNFAEKAPVVFSTLPDSVDVAWLKKQTNSCV